jgi:hypothetical protein
MNSIKTKVSSKYWLIDIWAKVCENVWSNEYKFNTFRILILQHIIEKTNSD